MQFKSCGTFSRRMNDAITRASARVFCWIYLSWESSCGFVNFGGRKYYDFLEGIR